MKTKTKTKTTHMNIYEMIAKVVSEDISISNKNYRQQVKMLPGNFSAFCRRKYKIGENHIEKKFKRRSYGVITEYERRQRETCLHDMIVILLTKLHDISINIDDDIYTMSIDDEQKLYFTLSHDAEHEYEKRIPEEYI